MAKPNSQLSYQQGVLEVTAPASTFRAGSSIEQSSTPVRENAIDNSRTGDSSTQHRRRNKTDRIQSERS